MATTTVTQRIHNFSAGPAVLPMPVLEEAQRDLLMLPGVGMSVLEISHRSAAFDEIIEGAERDLRALLLHRYQWVRLTGGCLDKHGAVGNSGSGICPLPAGEHGHEPGSVLACILTHFHRPR